MTRLEDQYSTLIGAFCTLHNLSIRDVLEDFEAASFPYKQLTTKGRSGGSHDIIASTMKCWNATIGELEELLTTELLTAPPMLLPKRLSHERQ